MEIKMKKDGTEMTVTVTGKLDTSTSPELNKALDGKLTGLKRLVFDFKELKYISSAGLRVVLTAMQTLSNQGGETVVKDATSGVLEVFEMTGLIDDLLIE